MDVTSATWLDLPPSHKLISLFRLPLTSIDCHECPIIVFLSINPTSTSSQPPFPRCCHHHFILLFRTTHPNLPFTSFGHYLLSTIPLPLPPLAASTEESVLSQSGPIHVTFQGCRHTVPTSPKTQKFEPALSHILSCIHICAS